MDGADRELLERSLRHACERHTGAALDAALDELGWPDALADDRQLSISTLFELQGALGVTSSASGHVLRAALGLDAPVLLPWLGGWSPPGVPAAGRLIVAGVTTARAEPAERSAQVDQLDRIDRIEQIVVVTRTIGPDVAMMVNLDDLALRAVEGLDPWLGLVEVTGEVPTTDGAPVDWSAAVRQARLAVAHELVGASRTMLDLARRHALERIQFGRPIAAFQAVRHRLADTLVAIEGAAAVIDAAWLDGSPSSAAMAKAVAGRSARTAARHAQQVLAGIGFTTEHRLHRFVRRVLVLDELFGPSRALTKQLGEDVLRARRLPPLLPL